MTERLDRVTILLNRGPFVITWDARQALMERLYNADIGAETTGGESTDAILQSFEAVGATRPVELTEGQRILLLDVLRAWDEDEKWALEPSGRVPSDLVSLLDALVEDLHGPRGD